jgi:hypothetical protein
MADMGRRHRSIMATYVIDYKPARSHYFPHYEFYCTFLDEIF